MRPSGTSLYYFYGSANWGNIEKIQNSKKWKSDRAPPDQNKTFRSTHITTIDCTSTTLELSATIVDTWYY